MKITWVTRSFLDYRIPVFEKMNQFCGNQLTIIYFKDVVPQRCQNQLKEMLDERAIGLSGEFRIGGKKKENQTFANKGGLRIPLRPGLISKVRNSKPDAIISDGFFQWTYAALVNNACYKTPHIMCYERTGHTERNVTTTRILARKIASRFITNFCANGIQTREYLLSLGISKNKIFTGNMAADSFALRKNVMNIPQIQSDALKKKYSIEGQVFLYVGQLIARKGIMELLNSWKKFSTDLSDKTLVLVGDGNLKQEIENFIRINNLKNVKLVGKVDYSEINLFYAAADIFIIATLEDNWSLVVPEAMSCNLPIISSKYNGCWPELIKSENGWIFDPLNSDDFERTLRIAWENRKVWKKMGNASYKIVRDHSPEKVAENIYMTCKSSIGR